MIKIISHRGNLNGPDPKKENKILTIDHCLNLGFDVEIDCWQLPDEDCFRLGHNKPIMSESVPLWYLENPRLLVHCKNKLAYQTLCKNPKVNCFVHDDENWAKTSSGQIIVHGDIPVVDFIYQFQPKENDLMLPYKEIIYAWFVNLKFDKEMMGNGLKGRSYSILTDYPVSYKEGLK